MWSHEPVFCRGYSPADPLESPLLAYTIQGFYMPHPTSPAEYLELVDQAIFEVEDLVRCAEDEDDDMVEFASRIPVYQDLLAQLRVLHAAVADGSHRFGGKQDLPFMTLVRQNRSRIPFYILLGTLNTLHKEGL